MRTTCAALSIVLVLLAAGSPAQARQAPGETALDLVKEARRLTADGRVDEAAALYDKATALAPGSFEANLGAGIVYDLKLDFARARRHLMRALELAPDDQARNMVRNALAVSYAFEDNAREAATFYQKVFDAHVQAENYGSAAATANALGRVYLETGDVENAYRWYETGYETARRQPDTPGAQLRLWEFRWLHAQGRIAARAGRFEEAGRHVAAARRLVEQHAELKDDWPTWHYLAGYVALMQKKYSEAVDQLQQADRKDPFILALLAQAYDGAGNSARARETWQQVLESGAHNLQNAFARPLAVRRQRG